MDWQLGALPGLICSTHMADHNNPNSSARRFDALFLIHTGDKHIHGTHTYRQNINVYKINKSRIRKKRGKGIIDDGNRR